MITAQTDRHVETNAGESNAFTIKATGKAFKVLINGLYANKIQSITREIWSNAFDAHVMAGNEDKPFDVTFPTAFHPEFRVRDYGTGLSHKDVMSLYTTIFESTKEGTNEQVGKLGLGSKSPFAYTDTFAVTVWKDGEKRHYAAVVSANGVPTINHMGTEATDEPNGLEVSFPVAHRDIREFRDAAHRVSLGFKVKPNVLNTDDFRAWRTLTPIMEGDGWKLYSGTVEEYGSNGAYAHMGCVLYPLDKSAIGTVPDKVSALLSSNFVIDFAIGDLEITASREALSYGKDEPTTASVIRRLTAVYDELLVKYTGKYDACANYHEACKEYEKDIRSAHIPSVVRNIITANAVWNGRRLTLTAEVPDIRGINMAVIDEKRLKNRVVRPANWDKGAHYVTHKATAVIIHDSNAPTKRLPTRVTQVAHSGKYAQIIRADVAIGAAAASTAAVHALMDAFEGFDIIAADDIELPHVERKPRSKVRMRCLTVGGVVVMGEDTEFPEEGLFLPMERNDLVVPAGFASPTQVLSLLNTLGAQVPTVWCVPKSLMKHVTEDWTNFYDWAIDWYVNQRFNVSETDAMNTLMFQIKRDSTLSFISDKLWNSPSPVIQDALLIHKEACNYTYVDADHQTRLGLALRVQPVAAITSASDAKRAAYRRVLDRIEESYPLIEVFKGVSWPSDNLVDKMSAYVAMMDSKNHNAPLAIAA